MAQPMTQQQPIDRTGMRRDLLEMAERVQHDANKESGAVSRRGDGNYSRWADLYIFATNCHTFALELSREEGE